MIAENINWGKLDGYSLLRTEHSDYDEDTNSDTWCTNKILYIPQVKVFKDITITNRLVKIMLCTIITKRTPHKKKKKFKITTNWIEPQITVSVWHKSRKINIFIIQLMYEIYNWKEIKQIKTMKRIFSSICFNEIPQQNIGIHEMILCLFIELFPINSHIQSTHIHVTSGFCGWFCFILDGLCVEYIPEGMVFHWMRTFR